jgi:hypothetical protein
VAFQAPQTSLWSWARVADLPGDSLAVIQNRFRFPQLLFPFILDHFEVKIKDLTRQLR